MLPYNSHTHWCNCSKIDKTNRQKLELTVHTSLKFLRPCVLLPAVIFISLLCIAYHRAKRPLAGEDPRYDEDPLTRLFSKQSSFCRGRPLGDGTSAQSCPVVLCTNNLSLNLIYSAPYIPSLVHYLCLSYIEPQTGLSLTSFEASPNFQAHTPPCIRNISSLASVRVSTSVTHTD